MSTHTDKFEFCTKENEQIDAVIKVYGEKNSVIHGVVLDCENKPIKNAVVKLLEKIMTHHGIKLVPLTHAFTDNFGEFIFGPLCPNKKYVLKVWYNSISIKKIYFDNSDCDTKCSCIKNEYNSNNPTGDCADSFITYNNDCDYNNEPHSDQLDCDYNHCSKDECECNNESHSHRHHLDSTHKSHSHLEEFQKRLQTLYNSNDKNNVNDSHLPVKKSKERNHQHRRRHHHKDTSSD